MFVVDFLDGDFVCDRLLFAGHTAYDRLRPLSYPDCDVVLVCFDLSQPGGIKEVEAKVQYTTYPLKTSVRRGNSRASPRYILRVVVKEVVPTLMGRFASILLPLEDRQRRHLSCGIHLCVFGVSNASLPPPTLSSHVLSNMSLLFSL